MDNERTMEALRNVSAAQRSLGMICAALRERGGVAVSDTLLRRTANMRDRAIRLAEAFQRAVIESLAETGADEWLVDDMTGVG